MCSRSRKRNCKKARSRWTFLGTTSIGAMLSAKAIPVRRCFCKEEPLQVIHEVGVPELDTEGRVVICEFAQYWFVNVYTPNAQSELARLDHRMAWDDRFRDICKGLEEGVLPNGQAGNAKPVVMCGDFNVAHQEIDLKNPRSNRGNPGFFR